jgi:exopolysaccharide biosynthesis protein
MNSPEKPYLKLLQRQETKLEDGVTLLTTTYEREDGNAFAAYFLIVAPGKAYLLTGTANCGYGTIDCTALVPEQMASVRQEGHDVLAGINCGYFRRKDHCRPYGLSIRNGIEIAPPYSEPRLTISNIELGRRWLGVTADHRIIHGTDETYPAHKDELVFAASFTHFLVQNGQINYDETIPGLEPRTGISLCKDGSIIFSAVDGRQPGYSVGCTLFEHAQLLIDLGAETVFHIDGGGSTNLSVCSPEGEIVTINRPSEQRKVFDTLILARYPK